VSQLASKGTVTNNTELYQIFERSRFANESGAAIHICPNASRVLEHWGYDFVRSSGMVVEQASLSIQT
jgi:salicylate hydroxylase